MAAPKDYLATPAGEGPWPGVVVLHEVFGVNDDIRAWADRFAAEGYLALAVDLYGWGSSVRCLIAAFRSLQSGRGRAFDDIEAARERLAGREDCTGRVGVIGFCMGGGFALIAAPRGFAVSSVNYAHLPKDPGRALRGACPVVASYGARDVTLRGTAAELEAALDAAGVEHDVKEYPEASHSFLNHHTGAGAVIDKVARLGWHEPSAQDAWRRISETFERHLRQG